MLGTFQVGERPSESARSVRGVPSAGITNPAQFGVSSRTAFAVDLANDPNSDSRATAAFRVPDLGVRLELRRNGCPVAVTSVLRRSGHGQGGTTRRPPLDGNPV